MTRKKALPDHAWVAYLQQSSCKNADAWSVMQGDEHDDNDIVSAHLVTIGTDCRRVILRSRERDGYVKHYRIMQPSASWHGAYCRFCAGHS
uniref:Uncharacterized protein n=1 Tax=viral metagenome TaxID=1070528 RepID=A0A6M3LRZ8_9ZZZZ